MIAHIFSGLADRSSVERRGDSIWCGEIRKKKRKRKSINFFFFFQFLFLLKKLVIELNNIKKLAEVAINRI
jgi:hypothetical protein